MHDHHRTSRPRPFVSIATALVVALLATACLYTPGDTSQIELVSTTTVDGWQYEYYRNRAYPCSTSGYQTFLIGRKVGSSDSAAAPLWVRMRGGGFGYYDASGAPKPGKANKVEESQDSLLDVISGAGLITRVTSAPEGFRVLVVSMCNHDLYGGWDQPDPFNPNTEPDGTPRTTNGLLATKAAVAFARDRFPTDDTFLHGTSAGSFGALSVGWSMQLEGVPPTGIVADSGLLNRGFQEGQIAQGLPCALTPEELSGIEGRIHPALTDPDNDPHLLVARGELTVPVFHTWSRSDPNVCGDVPMQCTLADGSTVSLTSAMCNHEPLRQAIVAQGPASRSRTMVLCLDNTARPGACDTHVVTSKDGVNTEPGTPADYNAAIFDWVRDRMADS